MSKNYCPVCGYDLEFEAWEENKYPSDEICPSCGIQFGYHDIVRNSGDEEKIITRYKELRDAWIENGMKWHSTNDPFDPEPHGWNAKEQLKNIGIIL